VTARNQDFKLYQGDSLTLEVALTNADGTDYNPLEAQAMTWILTREPSEFASAGIVKTLPDGGISTISGGIAITISASDTQGLALGPWLHQLRASDAADVAVMMEGTAIIRRAIATSPPLEGLLAQPARSIALRGSV
jgi:hypothetical protein